MASGILSILDDVGALMDDVAAASKIATRKTAGILGDDLAVNAEKATGFLATRELPVLWAITKGSFVNKLIIVPLALLLTALSPLVIKIILVLGGFYLAYEGTEKIAEYVFHRRKKGVEVIEAAKDDDRKTEKVKIRSAITTDFILSVEIVIIALETVLDKSLVIQILTISTVALLATIGVYGLVALIVRIDDIGYRLIRRSNEKGAVAKLGHVLVKSLPLIIKLLELVGTIALLLVSGGIFAHNIGFLHRFTGNLPALLEEFSIGFAGGVGVLLIVKGVRKIFFNRREEALKMGNSKDPSGIKHR